MDSSVPYFQRLLSLVVLLGVACAAPLRAETSAPAEIKTAPSEPLPSPEELAKTAAEATKTTSTPAELAARFEQALVQEALAEAAKVNAATPSQQTDPAPAPAEPAEPAAQPEPEQPKPEAAAPLSAENLTEPGVEIDSNPAQASGSTAGKDTVANVAVQLPFGFTWGQNQEDVRILLKGIGVRVLSRQVVGQDREAWKLEGFIKPLLIGTTIYFTRGYMEEIEMQFGAENWKEEDYTRLRRKLVQQFNQVYGPNRVLSNERSTEHSVLQTLVGYQWQTQGTILRVFDYGASNGSEHFRTVSVHYKFRDEMRMASSTPGIKP
jgi:hypothetical protein